MNTKYVDSQGFTVYDLSDTVTARLKGFCQVCQHTFWSGERVRKHRKPQGFAHVDCIVALADKTPRRLNPKYLKSGEFTRFTGLDKAKLKKKAKQVIKKRMEISPSGN